MRLHVKGVNGGIHGCQIYFGGSPNKNLGFPLVETHHELMAMVFLLLLIDLRLRF